MKVAIIYIHPRVLTCTSVLHKQLLSVLVLVAVVVADFSWHDSQKLRLRIVAYLLKRGVAISYVKSRKT